MAVAFLAFNHAVFGQLYTKSDIICSIAEQQVVCVQLVTPYMSNCCVIFCDGRPHLMSREWAKSRCAWALIAPYLQENRTC